jgi:type I restriction enzyme S subunit
MTNRNQNRPGYKETKVGWIPEEWECVRLKEVSDINPEALSDKTDQNYMFHYIDLSTVNEGKLNLPSNKIAFREAPSRARRKVKKNDVLLATVRPNLKGFAYISFEANDIVCSTGYAVLRSKNEVISLYLFYVLFSHETERYFYSCVVGSNYPALNNSDVNNLKIPLPPLPEQKKIAEILSAWDRAIEQIRKLIDAKKRLKKGLMQQLLTGRIRFPEFGKPVTQKGELPDGWKEERISRHFIRIRRPVIPDVDSLNILSITAKIGFVDQRDKFSKVIAGKNLNKYVLINRGEFSYNKGNSLTYPQGCIFQLNEYDHGAVPNVYYSFAPSSKMIYPEFYKFYFEHGTLNRQLRRIINTGVRNDGLLNVSAQDFFSIKILIPPILEQMKISNTISNITREISSFIQLKSALSQQKRGLMQKLLTGEIRVITNN